MKRSEIARLVTYIEENLRASSNSGLRFVDAKSHQARLLSKQNHVVYGRRGAGKTSPVTSIKDRGEHVYVYLNLEDYKDITFPNIVIHILVVLLNTLLVRILESYPWYRFWRIDAHGTSREIKREIRKLEVLLGDPDLDTQQVSSKAGCESSLGVSPGVAELNPIGSIKRNSTLETTREIQRSKIDFLRLDLSRYKRLISSISSLFDNKPVFLIIDDFYFVQKGIQPELVDYFHRLTKDTSLYIKLATIKHRSKLYRRTQGGYIGSEPGHDIFEVDMDYSLDNYDDLQNFMKQLLNNAMDECRANIAFSDLFSGPAFKQLCLASGGGPRDFLSLFVTLANQASPTDRHISKVDVTEAATINSKSKFESMKRDSGDDDEKLERFLYNIKDYVYRQKKTNAFLVLKPDSEVSVSGRQAIGELVDLRLIRLIENNTSRAPSDGRRYEAYMLDLGLYDNSTPRNFKQTERGNRDNKSRKDELRAAPVVELAKLFESPPEGARLMPSTTPLATGEYKQSEMIL